MNRSPTSSCLLNISRDMMRLRLNSKLISSALSKDPPPRCQVEGFSPEGALDGVDLSTPLEDLTRALRQEVNYAVAHSLHRHSESLVNTFECVALRVV
jgi:hypothetical protein